ncbi:MAG: FAD-binding oxidoreductase [Pseudomonadota bacterium]
MTLTPTAPAPEACVLALSDIVGAAHVRTGPDTAKWSRDWTGLYQWQPRCVVLPASTAEVSAVVTYCHDNDIPMVPAGGMTGLTGATQAEAAVMIGLDRMRSVRAIKPDAQIILVDAGVIIDTINEVAMEHGLVFPLSFGARGSAMIGGALSTNAGGSNVLRYGSARALCLGVEVVLPDGRVMDLMSELRKDNSGLDLKHLFIGGEGTLGLITGAVLKLSSEPAVRATAMIGMDRLAPALGLLNRLQEATGGAIEAFEYMPRTYIAKHVDKCGGREPFDDAHPVNILVEAASTRADDARADADGTPALLATLQGVLADAFEAGDISDATVAQNEGQRTEMWTRREDAAEITFDRHPLIDNDIALPLEQVPAFLDAVAPRIRALDPGSEDFIIAHLGDGNLHYTVYPTRSDAELKDAVKEAIEEVVRDFGGSFSAEHGVGTAKLNSMTRRKDAVALDVMRSVKAALDPKGLMNPGKVFPNA